MGQKLRLVEFKELYRRFKKDVVWFDHLLLAVLVWLEEYFLDLRVETAVNRALHDYERLESGQNELLEPTYSESGSGFFDEISYPLAVALSLKKKYSACHPLVYFKSSGDFG